MTVEELELVAARDEQPADAKAMLDALISATRAHDVLWLLYFQQG